MNDQNQQPNGGFYQSTSSGIHNGWLRGPAGADFDLYLFKWDGAHWVQVAKSDGPTENEQVSYNGTPGFYIWVIVSASGSGSYKFWLQRP